MGAPTAHEMHTIIMKPERVRFDPTGRPVDRSEIETDPTPNAVVRRSSGARVIGPDPRWAPVNPQKGLPPRQGSESPWGYSLRMRTFRDFGVMITPQTDHECFSAFYRRVQASVRIRRDLAPQGKQEPMYMFFDRMAAAEQQRR